MQSSLWYRVRYSSGLREGGLAGTERHATPSVSLEEGMMHFEDAVVDGVYVLFSSTQYHGVVTLTERESGVATWVRVWARAELKRARAR
jgi:hypothetical protein